MTKIKKISWQAFMIVGVVFTVITYIVLGLSGAWIQDRDGGSSEAQLGHGIVIKIQNVEDGTIYPGLGGWSQVYDSTVTDKKYAYPGDKILNQTNLLIESTTPALVRVKVAPVVQETTDGTTFTLVDLTKTYSPEDVNGVSAPSDASDLTAIKAYHDALSATIPKRASYSSDDDYNTAYAAYKAKADVWNKFLFTQMTKSIKMTNESDWTLINGWKYLNTITGNTQTPSTNEEVTVALYDEISLSLYFTAEIQQWKVSVGIQAEAIQAAHSDKIEHPWHNDVALIKTLFDGWETESCTITFDTQGGDALDPITQDSGTALTLPTPTKAGFDFVCWHLDEALTTPYNPNYMPARDVTLYAGWEKGFDWTSVYTTDGNGTITGLTEYGQTLTELKIPSKIGSETITAIGDSAFAYGCDLTSISLPDSVTTIGENSFNCCCNLTNFRIPEGVVSIGSGAFVNCCALTSINIPNGLTEISDSTFSCCESLTSITIPSGVTTIGESAFANCCALTSINIPNGLTEISDYAFNCCESLTSITIPSGVTTIGASAFGGCTGLTSITIPSSVTTIGASAFGGCSGVTSVVVDENNTAYKSVNNMILTKDGKTVVQGFNCSGSIPEGVTTIGLRAFDGCRGLTSIILPSGVTTIGDSAFSVCSGLTSITIPSSVTTIGTDAFYNCSGLTSITIPEGLTTIESRVFYGCSGLTSITIPSSVTTIGNYAFYNCSGLTSITIPSSVTTIGSSAFSGCSGLTSITIPSSVTTIGKSAFRSCTSLVSLTIPFVGGSETENTYLGYIFGASSYSYNSSYVPKTLKSVVVTGGSTIGNQAFYNCSGLTSITIPSSVTTIGSGAFNGCSGLTSITILEGVKTIEFAAFRNCSGLTSITIPSSVTTIRNSAFLGCSGLTSITIPSSVTTIGSSAFSGCSKLTSITFEDASGWYATTSSSYTGGTSTNLSVPTTNATYFTNTYKSYYWYKQNA